jgi:coenzyme F420 hydrogenase subunit beta
MTRDLFGGNWGHAVFQLPACDYCDDIFGETADACFGDAWIERYASDWRGTNVVVVRDPEMQRLMQKGRDQGELELDEVLLADVIQSQEGNYRHRWDGLSVRSQNRIRRGLWVPEKRVGPGSRPVDGLRRLLIRIREDMSRRSHQAFVDAKARGDLGVFIGRMRWHVTLMNQTYRAMRIKAKLQRIVKML